MLLPSKVLDTATKEVEFCVSPPKHNWNAVEYNNYNLLLRKVSEQGYVQNVDRNIP